MKKTIVLALTLFIATLGMAQTKKSPATLPSVLTLTASGSVGSNSTSYLAGSVGIINKVTGPLYFQDRVTFVLANQSLVKVGITPSIPLKTWNGASSLYVGAEVSATFSSGETYVQTSPELGVICKVGKSSYSIFRLNYDLRDNTNHNTNLSIGFGIKL